jgi:phi13 family phage major tail protein
MANRVKYGLKSVYYAVCTVDAVTNVATYGTPKPWPGAVSLSLDAEGGTTKFRADNIDYWVGQSNNGYSGDFESALIPDSFREDILGDVSPTGHDGVLIEDAGALTKYFALLFQFEGDDSATRHVMYKCSATRPSVSGQTTDEEIEPQTETLTLTATAIHNATLDKDIVKARCAADDSAYGSWFSAVWQPTGTTTT